MEKFKEWLLVWWPWVALGAVALIGGGAAVVYKARGLKNNNPGNIRKNDTPWDGLSPTQTDPAFFQFTKPFYGLRALARTLVTNQSRRRLRSVTDIINSWAPPFENDTREYIDFVADHMGVDPAREISLAQNPALLRKMVEAIVKMENGSNPYSPTLISQASASAIAAG